jgi:hypothetical protein
MMVQLTIYHNKIPGMNFILSVDYCNGSIIIQRKCVIQRQKTQNILIVKYLYNNYYLTVVFII